MSISENLRAKAAEVTERELIVELEDGTRHSAPIALFPILADATPEELRSYECIGDGRGLYWPDLDEHVSVLSIVHPEKTTPMRAEMVQRHLARNRERRARRTG